MSRMIDIHCHILPDIDDGPKTFEESVAMAKIAAKDGITVTVATPHLNKKLYDHAEISRRVFWLRHLLRKEKVDLQIVTGADVSTIFSSENLHKFTINSSSYILIEFPHSHLPLNAKDILYQYRIHGFNPIITHPERNPSIMNKPKILLDLLQDGVYVQVTAGSLLGEFGQESLHCVNFLMEKGVVDVLATDAHSASWRKPILSEGLRAAIDIVGVEEAMKMVWGTPKKIITNQAINNR